MNDDFGTDSTQTLSGVTGQCGVISTYNGLSLTNTNVTFDCSGNVGVRAALKATTLNASGLTASKCVATDGSKNLASTASTCSVAYANGTILGGAHIETGSANVVATTTQVFTFAVAYAAAPICSIATTGNNLGSGVTIQAGYPTTTQIGLYNSFTDRIGSFVCVGF
jgi:hypothetical protein